MGVRKGLGAGMQWRGGEVTPLPHPGLPAYAQPLSRRRQVPASVAFVTDSNRPQPLRQPPTTACLTASGAVVHLYLWGHGRHLGPSQACKRTEGPQRGPQKRSDRRLEEVAQAVGGGYFRLQPPLKLALGVRGTVAGHRLGALKGGGGCASPPSNASLPRAVSWRRMGGECKNVNRRRLGVRRWHRSPNTGTGRSRCSGPGVWESGATVDGTGGGGKERARNWEERKQQSNWAQSRPTHGSETSPNRTHNNTQGNHEVRALPPNAAHAERAISKHPPPLTLQGAHVLHKGRSCAPHTGRCLPRGWQQGRDRPTAHGTVHVVRRCEILVPGGRRLGQEGVRNRGTQERQQTEGGATQTHRTREPHQEGQGRAQQTRRRGTARQERQPEQREQGTRMERMGECAHGRQRQ